MTEENTEYNMAEDLLRDLDALMATLKEFDALVTAVGSVRLYHTTVGALMDTVRRARKIAQVYYDRVK